MSLIQFIKSKLFLKQLAIAFVGFMVVGFIIIKWLNITTNHNQKIEVPKLGKMTLKNAEKVLDGLELNYVVMDSATYNPNFPKKSVIDQSPEAGDFVKEGRKIYITLNPSGYANVEIPDLLGKTKRQATSQLKAIGFRVSAEEIYVADIAKDVVRGLKLNGKDLNAGDKIPQNSEITLKLGDGKRGENTTQTVDEENQ